jgi:uncharacterized repeat protein (TIGR01451 family)
MPRIDLTNICLPAVAPLARQAAVPPRPTFAQGRNLLRAALLLAALGVAPAAQAALGVAATLTNGPATGNIYPGEITSLRIELSNSSTTAPITGVAFSNGGTGHLTLPGILPDGLKIAGAASYACANELGAVATTGTLTADIGSQDISLSGGTIPARSGSTDGTCTIDIPVTAGTSTGVQTGYSFVIAAGAVKGSDGAAVANPNPASQSVNVNAMARPTIAKSFASSSIYLGGTSTTLTLTITNNAPAAIAGVGLTDFLPGNIQVAATPGVTSVCSGAGVAPAVNVADNTMVVLSGGTLAAGGTCTVTVQVEGKSTNGLHSWLQSNTLLAADFTSAIGLTPSANATPRNITVTSPLAVSKTVGGSFLSDGQSSSFVIRLTNHGTAPLTINSFTDDPIDGTTAGNGNAYGLKVDSVSPSCSADGTAGTFTATANNTGVQQTANTTIAANGGYCDITIAFTAHVQTAGIPDSRTNTLPAINVGTATAGVVSETVSATVIVADDLRVTKSVSPPSGSTGVVPGSAIRYAVTVQNFATTLVTDVVISDPFTNGQTFITGVIDGVDYSPMLSGAGCAGLTVGGTTTEPTFTIGTLPGRASPTSPGACTVTFYAMTAAGGTLAGNVIPAGKVCYNSGVSCNGGASNTVTPSANPAVASATKVYNKTSPQPEGTIVRATITVNNWSANPLAIAVADNLPQAVSGGQMRVANPANAATTCGGTPVITAVPGSTSVGMSGASVPARGNNGTASTPGSCTLQVDVVAGAGRYTASDSNRQNRATVSYTAKRMDGSTSTGSVNADADFVFDSSLCGTATPCTKTFNPASVSSGGKSTVTVRLTNSGALALANVSLTDPLPAGMVLANPPNAYSTCAGPTAITAAAGANTASLAGAALAGNGNCDFVFDVVATGAANWINTIPAGNITADGGINNQSAVTGTLNYNAPNNPLVSKSATPGTLTFPGQVSRLEIVITNGGSAVTNLSLTDHFTDDGTAGAPPNGMVVAATPATTTTCPGGIVVAAPGGASVSVSGVSLAGGASCTVSVNVSSNKVGTIINYIPVGSIVTDQGLTNGVLANTSLATSANLGVTKQFTPNVVKPGERSRLRITIHNPTTKAVSGLGVTDSLPAGVTVPSGANPATTCGGATVSVPPPPGNTQVQVSGGSLPGEASCWVEIDVTAVAQGDYTNTIPTGGLTGTVDGAPVNNPEPASDILHVKSPLVVHKAFSNLTLDAGNPAPFTTGADNKTPGTAFTLTVRLDNPNAASLTGAAFTDLLPAGLVVATTPAASTTCAGGTVVAAPSATQIRLSGGTIPATGFCTVTVNVLSNISGTYTNAIVAGDVTTTEGVTNEEPTGAQVVISTPPTVAKQFDPAVIPPSGTSTLTIVLGNDNASAITLTSAFTDTLPTAPGNIVVHATPNASTTCGGAVTAAPGSGTISLANGASIPAGGCTISVDVTGTTPGVHTNNIPAGDLKTSVGNNQDPANSTLTISTLGYVSGKVFRDNNVMPDGLFNGTDTPVAGETVELRSGADCTAPLAATTVTDALGNYLFSGLAAGTYSVCQPAQPAGTTNGIATAGGIVPVNGSGGAAGASSNPTATSSQVVNIQITAGGGGEVSGSTNNNFAEVVPSSIAGTVFLDQNNNGVQNGPDAGIAGVTVELLDAGNAVIATTTTDADGHYRFDNLPPGTYSVREPTQPADTSNGKTVAGAVGNGGTPGTPTLETMTPSEIAGIVLSPDTVAAGNDFAEIPHGRTVSGRAFLDYDNNGLLDDPRDHGIGGETINLTGTDINGNPVSRSTTTTADGRYSFTGLPAGTYTVSQPNQPAGTTNGTPTAGTTGGAASNPTPTTSQVLNLDLTNANTVSADNDFAEVPGAAPDLTIAKTHSPGSFAAGGTTGYYTVTASNIGLADTAGAVTVADTLPAGITPVTAIGTGWTCGIAGQVVTCATSAVIAANGGVANPITLHVAVAAGLEGQLLVNHAVVSGGGEPPGFEGNNEADDPTPIAGAGSPASLAGHVWHDANHDRAMDPGETKMPGWTVELLFSGVVVATTTTDGTGAYLFTGLPPGAGYQVRFREPTSGGVYGMAVPNEQGNAFTNNVTHPADNPAGADASDGTLSNLTLAAGDNVVEQSLPLDPAGVVYDAVTRQPVAGASVTISGPGGFDPNAHVVGGNPSVITGADGFYQFLLFPAAPAGVYTLTVTAPAGYLPAPSTLIPACAATPIVGAAPDPALVQDVNTAPGAGVPDANPAACPGIVSGGSATTQYFFSFDLTPGVSANVLNNHIPLDPLLGGAIVMTKTTPLVNVNRGDLVPYTVTATNTLAVALANIDVVDRIPPGFRYRSGSATLDGQPVEPQVIGRDLRWPNQTFAAAQRKTWKMVLVVGTGVGDGEYTNQAWSLNNVVNGRVSNIAGATVRVIPDPTFDCSEIIGKVFDDKNANGYQDQGEPGIANVRVVTARGLLVTTDADGRFHVACAAIPQQDRGSNFVMKLDERTLPSGYRLTTENPRDVRVTRGKMVKLNFGAAVHRVVRLELTAAAFGDGSALAPRWQAELEALPAKLKGRPSILRIAYRGGGDDGNGPARLDAVAARIAELWKKEAEKEGKEEEGGHPLVIETELEGAR